MVFKDLIQNKKKLLLVHWRIIWFIYNFFRRDDYVYRAARVLHNMPYNEALL